MAKILICDDELESRIVLTRAVEGIGHSAICASDGERGWSVLLDNPDIALIITDMMMPGLDGRGFLERLRGDVKLSTLPVIIVSGVVSLKSVDDILARGASRFVPKPIVLEEVREYVQLLLKRVGREKASHSSDSCAL